jgi:hypothetical protein
MLECHKNSAKNVSNEWAIDAFINGLRRQDFIEELGQSNPKRISYSWISPIGLRTEKAHSTTSELAHPKMIPHIGIAAKNTDPANMMDTMGDRAKVSNLSMR